MGLIDWILNLAGILLWMGWRSIRSDPLSQPVAATLVGTLRRAEPRRLKGWQFLVGLAALLLTRALLYWQIGPEAAWTPRLDLFFVVLAFRSDLLLPAMLYSVLSFARLLIVCYFWLLALVVINRRSAESDPVQKMVRQHIGPVARWPWILQVILPLLLMTGLWIALHPLLAHLAIVNQARSMAHLVEQGLLVGAALYLTLQYPLPLFLFAYLVTSYVYLGPSPLWGFITTTSRNLLAPLRWLPLRLAKFDFASLVGVVLIFLLLHWLPNLILERLAQDHAAPWPQ
jgi:uncharacterized protein YggT (Ycf19 family)